jgi:hypothetical protein
MVDFLHSIYRERFCLALASYCRHCHYSLPQTCLPSKSHCHYPHYFGFCPNFFRISSTARRVVCGFNVDVDEVPSEEVGGVGLFFTSALEAEAFYVGFE